MSVHGTGPVDEELRELAIRITRVGGLAEKLLTEAMLALDRANEPLARQVIAADDQIDSLEHEIEERALFLMARPHASGGDLRELVTAIKVASDLERIGDLAKNIAKRVIAIQDQVTARTALRGIDRMSRMALEQLRKVLDAYAGRDVEAALEVWRQDFDLDAMCTSVFRELLTHMREDPHSVAAATHLLFASKNIERIGDHTTNIAEMIHYLVKGEPLREQRPKKDSSNFVRIDPPSSKDAVLDGR